MHPGVNVRLDNRSESVLAYVQPQLARSGGALPHCTHRLAPMSSRASFMRSLYRSLHLTSLPVRYVLTGVRSDGRR